MGDNIMNQYRFVWWWAFTICLILGIIIRLSNPCLFSIYFAQFHTYSIYGYILDIWQFLLLLLLVFPILSAIPLILKSADILYKKIYIKVLLGVIASMLVVIAYAHAGKAISQLFNYHPEYFQITWTILTVIYTIIFWSTLFLATLYFSTIIYIVNFTIANYRKEKRIAPRVKKIKSTLNWFQLAYFNMKLTWHRSEIHLYRLIGIFAIAVIPLTYFQSDLIDFPSSYIYQLAVHYDYDSVLLNNIHLHCPAARPYWKYNWLHGNYVSLYKPIKGQPISYANFKVIHCSAP